MRFLFLFVLFCVLISWFLIIGFSGVYRLVGSTYNDTPIMRDVATISLMKDSPSPFVAKDKRLSDSSAYEFYTLSGVIARSLKFLWLSNWSDDVSLSEVPMLGTHHSCTYSLSGIVSLYAKTQSVNLWRQLNTGVRCFDIRLRRDANSGDLYLYHDFLPLRLSWNRVASIFVAWLTLCSREALVLIVRDEAYKNHANIARLAFSVFKDSNITGATVDVITNNRNFTFVPTVGQIRGKIFAMNWDGASTILPWADNREFTVGRYTVSDIYDVGSSTFDDRVVEKCGIVRRFYESTSAIVPSNSDSRNVRVIFTSLAVANINPYTNVRYTAQRVNKLLESRYLKDEPMVGMILFLDFYEPAS